MAYTENDCKRGTLEHIEEVRNVLSKMTSELKQRGTVHDASKLESPEL